MGRIGDSGGDGDWSQEKAKEHDGSRQMERPNLASSAISKRLAKRPALTRAASRLPHPL
jgi:hypothetical protein